MSRYFVINIFIISILIVGCSPVDGPEYFYHGGTFTLCDTLCGGKVQGLGCTFNGSGLYRYVDSTKNVPDIRLNARINGSNKFIGVSIIANHAGKSNVLLPGLENMFHYAGIDSIPHKYGYVTMITSSYELPIADTIKKYQIWVVKINNSSQPNSVTLYINNLYFSTPAIVANKDTVICTVEFYYECMF